MAYRHGTLKGFSFLINVSRGNLKSWNVTLEDRE